MAGGWFDTYDFQALHGPESWGMSPGAVRIMLEGVGERRYRSVIEFGSGESTQAFCDMHDVLGIPETVDSLESEPRHGFKGKHSCLKLHIVPLLQWEDSLFQEILSTGRFHYDLTKPWHYRPGHDYNWYGIWYDMRGTGLEERRFDMCLLDGAFGIGRNLAFPWLKHRLNPGGMIWIHDYDDFNFEEVCMRHFEPQEITRVRVPIGDNVYCRSLRVIVKGAREG